MNNLSAINSSKFLSLVICLVLCACSTNPYADCAYGEPAPVFSDELKAVKSHEFKLVGMNGIESINFENGVILNLTQSGCNLIKQDFSFNLDRRKVVDNDTFWIKSSIEQFNFMGRLSPDLSSFAMWAAAIQGVAKDLKIGKQVMVEPGFSVTIDKIVGEQEAILRVTLQEYDK